MQPPWRSLGTLPIEQRIPILNPARIFDSRDYANYGRILGVLDNHDVITNDYFQKRPEAFRMTLRLSGDASMLNVAENAEEHGHPVLTPERVHTVNRFVNDL